VKRGRISRAVEIDEAVMVRADLPDVDLVKAGIHVRLDRRRMLLGIGPTRHRCADLLLGDELRGLLEVARRGQDLRELAAERLVATASSSISKRTSASGQRSPKTCSLSASPLP
jgi:hypothetical protein